MTARPLRSAAGFTYIGALVMVILIGIMLAQAAQSWRMVTLREREAELLYRGTEVRDALRRRYGLTLNPYGAFAPPGAPVPNPAPVTTIPANAPKINEIKDLVNATDTAAKQHFLRPSDAKVVDPVTGQLVDWALYKDPATQRITGVFLKNENAPLKQGNFPTDLEPNDFEGKKHYSDWIFICDRYPKPGSKGGVQGLPGTSLPGGATPTSGGKPQPSTGAGGGGPTGTTPPQ